MTDIHKNIYKDAVNEAYPLDPALAGTEHISRITDKRIGFIMGTEFAHAAREKEIAERDATIKQLQDKEILGDRRIVDLEHEKTVLRSETHDLGERLIAAEEENQRLKGLLKEWIDQFGYPGKSLTNDTLDAIKQKP